MAKKALIALFYIGVWQLLAMAAGNKFLLPSPLATLEGLLGLALTGRFYLSVALSLLRVLGGFLLGVFLGTLLGLFTGFSPFLREVLGPLKGLLKATPVASFIILLLLWLNKGVAPLVATVVMVMPLIWANVDAGLRSTDKNLLEMARVFRLGRAKTLRFVYAPSVLPQYLAACTTALGFAWKAGVAAEVIAQPALSIGRGMYESKIYIETPELFAWTLVVVLLSMALEVLVSRLLGRLRA